jgi:hypothetical protein
VVGVVEVTFQIQIVEQLGQVVQVEAVLAELDPHQETEHQAQQELVAAAVAVDTLMYHQEIMVVAQVVVVL